MAGSSQQHGERLSAIDASFLLRESPTAHMHIGAVMVFDGPPPSFDDLLDHVGSRLHVVPRYRQRLALPPLQSGRPLWVDDERFDLRRQVLHTAVPAPGSETQLWELAARLSAHQLDRTLPLWRIWLVEGLAGERFALMAKVHHAMADGVACSRLASLLLDVSPSSRTSPSPPAWAPHPQPSSLDMAVHGMRGVVRAPLRIGRTAMMTVRRPARALDTALEAAMGLTEVVRAGLSPAPRVPLNVPIGPHRRVAFVRCELDDVKRVKRTLGGTVNDVVLAVIAGALGRWLRSRGVSAEGLELRALVPVSIRSGRDDGGLGNRLAAMRAPVPVSVEDPAARLRAVRSAMGRLKDSNQCAGAEVLARIQSLAPPTVLAQSSRITFSTRLFNLLVTNVPGPQLPLYLLGRELRDLLPIAFLPDNHALSIAILSYNGALTFGLLADYDAMPDLDAVAAFVETALAELIGAASCRSNGRLALVHG